jgi:hypothetical protein
MGQLVKYLTVTSVAAALALPAVAASGPSSAAGSPQRGTHAAAATLATSPDRGGFFPRRLPTPVWVERSGGFAGFRHRINIRSDGAWTFRDLRRGTVAQGHLTRWQIRALSRLLSDPDLRGEFGRPPGPTRCADAFEYKLTVLWHGWQRHASYTDCLNPGGPVVAVVRAVIDFTAL